jgi:uncharacterized membrane protein
MSIPLRLLQHWRTSKKQGYRLFPANALEHFHSIIEDGAQRHRAYLKLAIEVALPTRVILRNTSARHRACTIFNRHCTGADPERNHILIYINLADRQVEIVTDPRVARILTSEQWQLLCHHITHGFSTGDPSGGIDSALNELNALLERTLPATYESTPAPSPGQ